jgi:ABC-type nitrate/sulfonate/bicarbonate transport system permease component
MTAPADPTTAPTAEAPGPSQHPPRRRPAPWLPPVALLGGLVALWELVVVVADIPDYVLPAPSEVAAALVSNADVLVGHTVSTLTTAVVGLLAGTSVGVGLAFAMAASAALRRALYPLVVVSQSIPMVVLAPLFVVWFGFGPLPRLLVVALVSFFPVAVATVGALMSADRDQVDLVRAMGGSRRDVVRHVLLPGAVPGLFTGLKVAASYAMFAAVVGEWIGASSGLGLYLERSRASFATDQMFAAVVVIAAVSVLLVGLVFAAERLAAPWQAAERDRDRSARARGPW